MLWGICFKRYGHLISPVVGIIVLRCVMGSNGHMMGEYLLGAVITHRSQHSLLNFSIQCLASVFQTARIFFVFQSWVGLDTILYALKILGVLQVIRALPPFYQENVIE